MYRGLHGYQSGFFWSHSGKYYRIPLLLEYTPGVSGTRVPNVVVFGYIRVPNVVVFGHIRVTTRVPNVFFLSCSGRYSRPPRVSGVPGYQTWLVWLYSGVNPGSPRLYSGVLYPGTHRGCFGRTRVCTRVSPGYTLGNLSAKRSCFGHTRVYTRVLSPRVYLNPIECTLVTFHGAYY